MNCLPLSDVISNGIPNRDIHVIRALVQSSAVWSFMGMASGHRVYLSIDTWIVDLSYMIVNKYLFSLDVGRGPTMSTWMLVKRCDGVRNDFNGVFTCLSTLDCWQGKHSLDHCIASLLMLCPINLANSRRWVVFLPGWDKLCIKLNTFLFKLSGIIGRGRSLLVSQYMSFLISVVFGCFLMKSIPLRHSSVSISVRHICLQITSLCHLWLFWRVRQPHD